MVLSKNGAIKSKSRIEKNPKGMLSNFDFLSAYMNEENHEHHNKHKEENVPVEFLSKTYKHLNSSEKDKIVLHTAELIQNNYLKNHDFKTQLYHFSILFGNEKDWTHIRQFLNHLLLDSTNLDFITKICEKLFLIIDEEYTLEHISTNVTATCLALITEIGSHVKENMEKLDGELKIKHIFFIEFLTSNMMARSNINNETMRIGLVYYFSRVEPSSHINIEKILSRFGQSLLEHVLQTYFCNSKKSDLAFYFIIEHLDNFIFSSPALAEMSNSVLQNQMLKHTQDFPILMKKYISYKVKDMDFSMARSLVIHLSFLLKEACEVHQKTLIDSMLELTFSFIYLFENKSKDGMINLCDILGEIIATSKSPKGKEISAIIYDKILATRKMMDSSHAFKLIHMDSKSALIHGKIHSMSAKKTTPLDEILLLAS
ncbi:MAG: hypothetical protein V4591_01880 [Bdellovibrionota bacterium]